MSGASTWYPAPDSASIWWRHEYQSSGNPWIRTTGFPSPASATCSSMPFARVWRWRMPVASDTLDDRAGPRSAGGAHGHEADFPAGALELVEHGRDQPRA